MEVIAGGFDRYAPENGLRAWRLPTGRLDFLGKAGQRASGLGHLLANVAAAGAIAEPTGASRALIAVTALAGQTSQTGGFIATEAAGRSGRSGDRAVTATELRRAIERIARRGRPTVVALDDLDAAEPAAEWGALFVERWLLAEMLEAPILFLATARSLPGSVDIVQASKGVRSTDVLAALPRRLRGVRTTYVEAGELTARDVGDWLGDADDDVVQELLACGRGHPGWTTALFRHWQDAGQITRSALGAWTLRANETGRAGTTIRAYVDGLLWELLSPDVEAYDRATKAMTFAALEGPVFTADAVAEAMEMNRDDLIDWLDDRLVLTRAAPKAPFLEAGFVSVPSAGGVRHLPRYAWRSELMRTAFRGATRVSGLDTSAMARRYAQALLVSYGHWSGGPLGLVAGLFLRAGDSDVGMHYAQLAIDTTDRDLHDEVLEAEVAQAAARHEHEWDAVETLISTIRIADCCAGLEEMEYPTALIGPLELAYDMLHEVTEADPRLDVERMRAQILSQLGRHAFFLHWYCDVLACCSAAMPLWAAFGDQRSAAQDAILCVSSYARLLAFASELSSDRLGEILSRRLRVATDDSVASSLVRLEADELRRTVRARAETLLEATDGLIRKVAGPGPSHLAGELSIARSDLAEALREFSGAAEWLEDAASQFASCHHGDLCPRRGEAYARLTGVRWRDGDDRRAELAAETALRVLLTHGLWSRAAQVQHVLGHAYARSGDSMRAAEAVGFGIVMCRHGGARDWEAALWQQLSTYMGEERDTRDLVGPCLAMAVFHADARRKDYLAELTETTHADEASSTAVEHLLAEAESRWAADHAAELLSRAAGVRESTFSQYVHAHLSPD